MAAGTTTTTTKKLDPSARKPLLLRKKSVFLFGKSVSPPDSFKEAKTQAVATTVKTEVVPTLQIKDDEELIKGLSKSLIGHQWFHGVMPREEINDLLKINGDYLVRKTTEKRRPIICLSVFHNKEARHFPLNWENGTWFIKNMDSSTKFFELQELLDFLVSKKFQLPPTNAVLIRPIPRPEYYILHDDIILINKLGSGAFGEVWKGVWRKRDKTSVDVAVKRMKGNSTKSVIKEFVKEAKLMRKLKHPNIVTIIGVAPSEEPLMICIELASNGCLKNYLKMKKCTLDQLTNFCIDAARGMSYLSSQMIIHRDLAARNLLLGSHIEVKIADFGLSEAGKTEVKINKMKLPIRWLAPETIDTGWFTTKTDVWSYAVTIWEIFSYCANDPFPGLTNNQAKDLIRTKTPPMQAPNDTPSIIVRLMLDCFEKKPENRPTFPQLLKKLSPKEDVEQYNKQIRIHDGNGLSASTCSNSQSEKGVSVNGSDLKIKASKDGNISSDRAVRIIIPAGNMTLPQDSKRSKTKMVTSKPAK